MKFGIYTLLEHEDENTIKKNIQDNKLTNTRNIT